MSFVEPLEMQTWFLNIFSGDGSYFAILALFSITSMAAYFRMNGVGMAFMVGIFLLMFSAYIPSTLTVFITIIAGLLIGFWVSQILKK
jgi:hypothetical protein